MILHSKDDLDSDSSRTGFDLKNWLQYGLYISGYGSFIIAVFLLIFPFTLPSPSPNFLIFIQGFCLAVIVAWAITLILKKRWNNQVTKLTKALEEETENTGDFRFVEVTRRYKYIDANTIAASSELVLESVRADGASIIPLAYSFPKGGETSPPKNIAITPSNEHSSLGPAARLENSFVHLIVLKRPVERGSRITLKYEQEITDASNMEPQFAQTIQRGADLVTIAITFCPSAYPKDNIVRYQKFAQGGVPVDSDENKASCTVVDNTMHEYSHTFHDVGHSHTVGLYWSKAS